MVKFWAFPIFCLSLLLGVVTSTDESATHLRNETLSGQYVCLFSKEVIPFGWVCDGEPDCGPIPSDSTGSLQVAKIDMSDEDPKICRRSKQCPPNEFRCADSITCIEMHKVCDNSTQCPDGSDEGEFCHSTACDKLNCDYGCKPNNKQTGQQISAQCYCPIGQQWHNNRCVPELKCTFEEKCEQNCVEVPGSYKCTCNSGYLLYNNTDCQAINDPSHFPTIYAVGSNSKVTFYFENGTVYSTFTYNYTAEQEPLRNASLTFDVNYSNKTVCFAKSITEFYLEEIHDLYDLRLEPKSIFWNEIQCSTFDKSSTWSHRIRSSSHSSHFIKQLDFDWISHNWYLLDTINSVIFVCNPSFTLCVNVIDSTKLWQFAIDANQGYLIYCIAPWSIMSAMPSIMLRARLDGSSKDIILDSHFLIPDTIALDLANQEVYTNTDKIWHAVQSINYDGTNRRSRFDKWFKNGSNIIISPMIKWAVFEKKIFYLRQQAGIDGGIELWQFNLLKGKNKLRMMFEVDNEAKSIKVVHRQAQPNRHYSEPIHPCSIKNNGCEHLCIALYDENRKPVGECRCSSGFELTADQKSCRKMNKNILITVRDERIFIHPFDNIQNLQPANYSHIPPILVPTNPKSHPIAADYDHEENTVYFSDIRKNAIIKYTLPNEAQVHDESFPMKPFITEGVIHANDLAINHGNLYWTDSRSIGGIYVAGLKDSKIRKRLIHDEFPRSLVLDPKRGLMFFPSKGTIQRADMDGSKRLILIDDHHHTMAIAIDSNQDRMYFLQESDSVSRIHYSSLTGQNRGVLSETGNNHDRRAYTLFWFKGFLFWTVRDHEDSLLNPPYSLRMLNVSSKDSSIEPQVIFHSEAFISDVKLFSTNDEYRSEEVKSICNKCEHLCLQNSAGVVCACGDGFEILPNDPTKCSKIANYTKPPGCTKDLFECRITPQCLKEIAVCDKVEDCIDGSDEEASACEYMHKQIKSIDTNNFSDDALKALADFINSRNFECPDGGFRCNNGVCASHKSECHDEGFCQYPRKNCLVKNSSICVELSEFCNDQPICDDKSDESENCGLQLCHYEECSHDCQNVPFDPGFICLCPEKHRLGQDNRTCEDLNKHPCDSWDRCSHHCIPLENHKWRCECGNGYQLESDGKSCKSLDTTLPIVIYTSHTGIFQMKGLTPKNPFPISRGLKKPISIDFLYLKGSAPKIYWTDVVENKIYEGSLMNGVLTNKKAIIGNGLKSSEGLAVDWLGKNLYFIESSQIEVSSLSGKYRRTLISEDLNSPRAIVLDPLEGLLFFSDWGSKPYIARSSMDGTDRKILVKITPGQWPNGITLDFSQKRIYWIDAKKDTLSTCKYDGSDLIEEIFKNQYLTHPFAISLFQDKILWTDWRTNMIAFADKFSGKNLTLLSRTFYQPMDVKVLHSSRQPIPLKASPCEAANCSHLCLLSTNKQGFTCACPHSMKLENSICVSKESFIVLARPDMIRAVDSENVEESIMAPLGPPHVFQPDHLRVDSANKAFYWIDQDAIKRYYYENSTIETVFPDLLYVPMAFTIDSTNIYIAAKQAEAEITPTLLETISDEDDDFHYINDFTVKIQNTTEAQPKKKYPGFIFVQSLQGEILSQIKPQVEFLDAASIAVDEEAGTLYWSDKNDFKIRKCKLDGSQVKILTSSDFDAPKEFFIDRSDDRARLYWLAGLKIQFLDLENLTITKIYPLDESHEQENWPSSFAILKSKLFVVFGDENIRSMNKLDGSNLILFSNNTESTSISVYDSRSTVQNKSLCQTNNGNCDHLCVPIGNERIQCLCAIGFQLNSADLKSCQVNGELIIYSSSSGINSLILKNFSLSNSSLEEQSKVEVEEKLDSPTISRAVRASSLEFDNSGSLFMADSDEGSITRVGLDNSGFKTILSGVPNLGDFVFDWMSKNFYFFDEKFSTIEVFKLDSEWNIKSKMVLVYEEIVKLESLAIHPFEGLLFWSDVGHQNSVRIERSFLDGSNRTVIFELDKSKHLIQNLALDFQQPFLYFTDIVDQKILRINYQQPKNSVQILLEKIRSPIDLIVHNDFLYWADNAYYGGGIFRVNHTKLFSQDNSTGLKFSGSMLGVEMLRSETTVYDLQIYSSRKVETANGCTKNNGGCEDFCFFRGPKFGHRCACSYGFLNPEDSLSCSESDHFLLFRAKTSQLKAIHLEEKEIGRAKPLEVAETSSFISALSYDYESRTIFYADLLKNTISKCNFNGSSHEIVLSNQSQIGAMAFDQTAKMLFWSSLANATISKVSISDMKPEVILRLNASLASADEHDRIVDLVIDHCHSRIYWANCNWKSPAIQRSTLSGTEIETLIRGSESRIKAPSALALDSQFLFWADLFLTKIERCDLDAAHCVILVHEMIQPPINLALFQDQIFWSDQAAIVRANKFTGEDVKYIARFETVHLRFEFEPPMVVVTQERNQCQQSFNPCQLHNGGCEDICSVVNTTQIGNTLICSCFTGRHLIADKRRCQKSNAPCPGDDQGICADKTEISSNSSTCATLNCAQLCKDTPMGYQCSCYEGFESLDNGKICRDIDECQLRSCSHYCNNSYGSFHCYCQNGYLLDSDNRTCLSLQSVEAKLLFTAKLSVHQLGSLRKSPREMFIISSYFNPVAVDFDWKEDCIYWSEMTEIFAYIKRVCKLPKDANSSALSSYLEKNIETLHSNNIQSPVGIAIDWIGRNLYWADKSRDTIEVSTLDGKYRKVLIRENLEEPRAIVLNPLEGLLFYSDWGSVPYIARSSMDGTNQKIILDKDLGWPNALTIDYVRRELYYADARQEYIGIMDFNGQKRSMLFDGKSSHSKFTAHIFALSFFESRIYWSDWHSKVVVSCSTWNCTADNFRVHAYTNDRPMDVRVVHPDRQPALTSKSPCTNGSCFGLCLIKPKPISKTITSVCACPEEYVLADDGYSCRHNCLSWQFVCSESFKCIPSWYQCDGEKDCLHGEDEEDCECPGPSFRCANNTSNEICENGTDCSLGMALGKNNIAHFCPWATCSQLCTSTLGNYTCVCAEGYSKFPIADREEQDFTCEALGPQVSLLAASDGGFRAVNGQKAAQELLNIFSDTFNSTSHLLMNKSFVSKVESLDVYYSSNSKSQLFWTNPHRRTLYSMQIENIDLFLNSPINHNLIRSSNSSSSKTFNMSEPIALIENIANPRGVATDWIGENIYFIQESSIKVASFDGTKVKTLIHGAPLEWPYDIVVDPGAAYIFWSDIKIKIGRASLDGSQWRALVKTDLESPLGLALDHEAKRLYFSDPETFQIETVRYDGTDRRKLYNLRKLSHKPFRIELFEDWLYVTTLPDHHILKLDKFGRNDKRILSLVQKLPRLTDIVALQPHKQSKFVRNACSTLQNGTKPCPENFMCLAISSINFSCVCPDGFEKVREDCFPIGPKVESLDANKNLKCFCMNGGHCRYREDESVYCQCSPFYEGELCERFRCDNQCHNLTKLATCYIDLSNASSILPASYQNSSVGTPRCTCPTFFRGDRCDEKITECSESTCLNGGLCSVSDSGNVKCHCSEPFKGDECEFCAIECRNGGVCRKAENDHFFCECPLGFSGISCEQHVCSSAFCHWNGGCYVQDYSQSGKLDFRFRCRCKSGFLGDRCDQGASDNCEDVHCKNGGVCHLNSAKKAVCICSKEFSGILCEVLATGSTQSSLPADSSNFHTVFWLLFVLILILFGILIVYRFRLISCSKVQGDMAFQHRRIGSNNNVEIMNPAFSPSTLDEEAETGFSIVNFNNTNFSNPIYEYKKQRGQEPEERVNLLETSEG